MSKTGIIASVLLAIAACAPPDEAADHAESLLADLDAGWNHVEGLDETDCSHGTDFSFWFKPGETDKLAVYLQGGGACWMGEICALDRSPTYDPTVDDSDHPPEEGIFDFDEAENPIRDWSILFIPYCTADVHIGATNATYDVAANDSLPARSFEIRHQGRANVEATLNWVYDRIVSPAEVLVTGVSAGSLGSAVYAHSVAEHYPDARVVQIGDAAGGYRGPEAVAGLLEAWGAGPTVAAFASVDEPVTFETLYKDAARSTTNLRMAQINYDQDEVQLGFLGLIGIPNQPLIGLLDANLAEISDASPSFRHYILQGSTHGILRNDAFYDANTDGVRLSDWTASLIAGEDVASVDCEVCR
jgi:Pectinacetylesterase